MGASKSKKTLSIVTFNTFGRPFLAPDIKNRYIKIAQLLNEADYDVVCLQELFTYYHLFLFQKNLKHLPYCAYQKNPLGPKGGLAIFTKFPIEKKDYYTYSIPDNSHAPLSAYLAQPGILSFYIKDLNIRIATTHMSSDIVSNLTPKNKLYNLILSQSTETAKKINQYTKNDSSCILTGDFNISKNSKLYTDFVQQTKSIDIFRKEDGLTYSPTRLPSVDNAPPGRVDFIFLKSPNSRFTVLQTNHLFAEKELLGNNKKSYLSDHISLHCILEFNE